MRMRIMLLSAAFCGLAFYGHADELAPESIINTFERGGKIMWVILAASIVGCAFVAERLLAIRRSAQIPQRLIDELRDAMLSGGVAAGIRVVDGDKSAMGRVMYALLSRSGTTRRELETTVDESASRVLYDLRYNLRPVGIVASVAPMLGLLGTVFGLISAFRAAAELGMDDPRNFAAGIYEALYTTAFGLVVAIPLLILYHVLKNRADALMRDVEERALAFISAASTRAEIQRARTVPRREPFAEESNAVASADENSDGNILAASEETSITDNG
ncbi:MAG: MotA/TolQ/ExbB proton channel family protein [Planctomycetes bacterium]|nr:MotA/TolQ/ExbB proton channel family protein [Planctomycetota bacterium]